MAEERVVLEGRRLEKALAHRGRNLLIDRDECYLEHGEPFGESTLTLVPGDPAGRDIFLRRTDSGGRAIMEFAFAEHLALNAICVLHSVGGGLQEGDICYFASISGFKVEREVPAGAKALGRVGRKADKGPFRRFVGEMELAGVGPVAQVDITAFTLHISEEPPRDIRKTGEVVKVETRQAVDRSAFAWKAPSMVFVDEMVSVHRAERTAGFAYTYPAGHPFTPGHFPGNPVMMGITQWMSVSDACLWLARELVRSGDIPAARHRIVGSGELLRDDGTIVAEVKGLDESVTLGRDGRIGPPTVSATKRVVFRDMVRPGEPLRVRARIESISPAE